MNVTVAVAALAVLQGGPAVEKKNPTFEELVRMRVVWSVPGMDAVVTRRNLPYKTGDGAPLHMDVYTPPGPTPAAARGDPGPRGADPADRRERHGCLRVVRRARSPRPASSP